MDNSSPSIHSFSKIPNEFFSDVMKKFKSGSSLKEIELLKVILIVVIAPFPISVAGFFELILGPLHVKVNKKK